MVRTKKRVPPSRARYEESHPVISCRVPRSVYDQINAVKQADGKSFADIAMLGLGLAKPQVKRAEQLRKQGHATGYRDGYADAKARYVVTYPCSGCGELIEVTSAQAKASIKRHMEEHRWAHAECIKRRR